MLANDVLDAMKVFLTIESGRESEYLPACTEAISRISSAMKPGADGSDPLLIRAAAGLALYFTALRETADERGGGSVKAGDISVSARPEAFLDCARRIRDEALGAAAKLLRDTDFVFRRI